MALELGGGAGGSSEPGSTQQSRQQQPAAGPVQRKEQRRLWSRLQPALRLSLHGPPSPGHMAPLLTPGGRRQQLPVARRLPLPLLAGAQLQPPHVPNHSRGIESLLWRGGGC